MKIRKTLSVIACLAILCSLCIPAFAVVIPDEEIYNPADHPVVTEVEGEEYAPGGIQPRTERCACGGILVTRFDSETKFVKTSISAVCEHGMNGLIYKKVITYVTTCQSCGTGVPFTRTVQEVRCNH